ncbi:hypothetical protein OC683_02255 ['Crotalaria aegyptiaca' phytoplasma]|uniref:Uncharacterized protein n=1 Tax=Candidatus Phytoplasma crotalariae TaxID=2982627 RepID=A0ABT9D4C2_9MOLU|nr:hypothetical protein ['Crotalaria aegyptiaca' phytoplasma]MDO8059415.1 hypothetical protein ['Crotalaria aegyptiaca' phytoplasma]
MCYKIVFLQTVFCLLFEKRIKNFKRKINSNHFEFGLIYGRRRIRKTKLLKEINKHFSSIYFVAEETGLDINLQRLS